jgi:hypothetical protein
VYLASQNANQERNPNQKSAESRVHNNGVVQRMTDGHKPVISHHSQEHVIHISKYDKKRHLCQAAHIGDDSAVSLDVHNHFWDSGGDETDVSQGQVGEEEVHGGVEVGVTADGQNYEQVPKYSDQIHGQEQSK